VIVLAPWAFTGRGFPQWNIGYVGSHALRPAQHAWLVDLSTRIASDNPATMPGRAIVNAHIEAFLSSFREFA
jgi:hypothetical protein